MGYGDMSCQNPDSKIKTPNLDALASKGMRFSDAHSSSTVSSPSRYALLTGNYSWRRMTNVVRAFGPSEIGEDEMTMAKMLKEEGYFTAMVGKWHLGWDWASVLKPEPRSRFDKDNKRPKLALDDYDWSQPFLGGPIDRGGFDYYFGDGTINFPPYCWIENQHVTQAPSFFVSELGFQPLEGAGELRQGPAAEDWHPTKVLPSIADNAVRVIEKQDETKPFFLYCALSAPHAPIIPNEEFHGKSEAGYYGDFVVQCDNIVGRIISALDNKGLTENTIIVFSADNGAEWYAYQRMIDFDHNSTASLQGIKRDTWEGGHRVPFIVRWDGRTKGGAVCDEVISQVDLIRTFASIVGAELPSDAAVDSYNITPLLEGKKQRKPLREATVFHAPNDIYAIRQGEFVLIDNHTGTFPLKSEQFIKNRAWYNQKYNLPSYADQDQMMLLFNLKEDRLEMENLANKYPEKAAAMKRLLEEYKSSGSSIKQSK